jgi:hypothetical protein
MRKQKGDNRIMREAKEEEQEVQINDPGFKIFPDFFLLVRK